MILFNLFGGLTMRKHWYKEQRSKEYRRALYRALSHAGLPWELAARMRDWSEPHVKTFLSSNAHLLNKPPDEVWADFHQELVKEVFKVGDGSVVGGQE